MKYKNNIKSAAGQKLEGCAAVVLEEIYQTGS